MTNLRGPRPLQIAITAPVCDDSEVEQFFAIGPCGRWWAFEYDGKQRIAMVLGNYKGCLWALTSDGVRSFKPEKMIGITDQTVMTV